MAMNEWEEGTLVLPSAEFSKLRRELVNQHNAHQNELFEQSKRVYQEVKNTPNLKAIQQNHNGLNFRIWDVGQQLRLNETDVAAILGALLKYTPGTGNPPTLKAPLKKDFPQVKVATDELSNDEVSLTFNAKTREVVWCVPENKGAIGRAWKSHLGRGFKQALSQVKWTRDTGGVFLGGDESQREADHSYAGGGSSISQHFGPRGEKAYEDHHGYNPRTKTLVRQRAFR